MKKNLAVLLLAAGGLAFGGLQTVTIDQEGVIRPEAARQAIGNVASAVVEINVAEEKATILTNVARIANATVEEANRILNERADYAIIEIQAKGLKDAMSTNDTAQVGEIRLVDNLVIDRTSDPDNVLATVTWQYVSGSFNSPSCIATADLQSTNVWEMLSMTTPEQIEWGETAAFRATVSIPKATYGASCFLKISAKPNAPVDDGQVFDIYSDGTDYWVVLEPSKRYRMHIVSKRIAKIELAED